MCLNSNHTQLSRQTAFEGATTRSKTQLTTPMGLEKSRVGKRLSLLNPSKVLGTPNLPPPTRQRQTPPSLETEDPVIEAETRNYSNGDGAGGGVGKSSVGHLENFVSSRARK